MTDATLVLIMKDGRKLNLQVGPNDWDGQKELAEVKDVLWPKFKDNSSFRMTSCRPMRSSSSTTCSGTCTAP